MIKTVVVGCPGLEELVETGRIQRKQVKILLTKYLQKIIKRGADTVVLGCTHYPFLKSAIHRIAPALRLVDSGRAVAQQTRVILAEQNLLSPDSHGESIFYTTGDATPFSTVASKLLRRNISAHKATI